MNIKNGQTVNIHYVGTLNDGTEFDSSRKKNKPLSFKFGGGQILPAFEKAVQTMKIGERKTFSLTPADAYGELNSDAIQSVPKASFADDVVLEVGNVVQGQAPNGMPVNAKIASVGDEQVTLDFNHPLAGQDLNFDIELLSVDSE